MAGRTKSRRVAVDDGWGDLVEVPRANMPDPAKVVRKRRWLTVLVWAIIVAFLLSTLALLAMVANMRTSRDVTNGDTFSLAKVAGTQAMQGWLAGDPAPLVDGRILTVDGVSPVTLDGASSDDVKFSVDVVSFTLVDGFGQLYRSGVQVAVDPRGSATAISTPSLEPLASAASDSWSSGSPWPGLKVVGAPDPVKKAIEGWAAAYTSGDADTLRLAVGDPDAQHWYSPLAGVQQVSAETVTATPLDKDETVLAVQVRLRIRWVGQQVADGTTLPASTFDVLVERADTAAPVVTAWGAAGTGPNLVRYGNAIDGTGRTQPTVTATPEPTVSASPGDGSEPSSSTSPEETTGSQVQSPSPSSTTTP